MRTLPTLVTLFIVGCTPLSPSDTNAPHEVNTEARPQVNAGNAEKSGSISSSAPYGAAVAATATPLDAPEPALLPARTPNATEAGSAPAPPPLEHLTYHALPQTQLGFYAVLTPPGYDAPENVGRRYPLVVILHGSGSNELIHGSLADDFGREGIIYVLPRAPYPSPEHFAAGKEGFSGWPVYPESWGEYGSPTFPKTELLRPVYKLYTRWIAETVLDARSRYRVSHNRAVVVGHSEGATFAHLFAADYPALVRAYAAYAGPWQYVVSASDAAQKFASLRVAGIMPFLVHHDGDTIVDVANTQALDAKMTEQGVKHTTHILPGGTHATDPEVRRLLRAFTREQCCGKERTVADIPVGKDGTLTVPAIADTVTFGPETCDEHISAFTRCPAPTDGTTAQCMVYEAEPCGRRSFGYRSSTFECKNSVWTQVAKDKAECGVQHSDPKVTGCKLQLFRTRPSAASKTAHCDLVARCDGVETVVTCNGNDDDTSVCECKRDGEVQTLPQNTFAGHAPEACVVAALHCAGR